MGRPDRSRFRRKGSSRYPPCRRILERPADVGLTGSEARHRHARRAAARRAGRSRVASFNVWEEQVHGRDKVVRSTAIRATIPPCFDFQTSGMPRTEQAVVTVAERKAIETARRVRAAAAIVEAIGTYAKAKGGRFAVFGSYVDGRMKHDSGLDVMVDFDAAERRSAWELLETLASRFDLPVDLFDRSTTKDGFVRRVETTGLVLS